MKKNIYSSFLILGIMTACLLGERSERLNKILGELIFLSDADALQFSTDVGNKKINLDDEIYHQNLRISYRSLDGTKLFEVFNTGSKPIDFNFYDFDVSLKPQGVFSGYKDDKSPFGFQFNVVNGFIEPGKRLEEFKFEDNIIKRIIEPLALDGVQDGGFNKLAGQGIDTDKFEQTKASLLLSERELAIQRLYELPEESINLRGANLEEVFARLADLSGISYSIPSVENSKMKETNIRMRANKNPFKLLEILAAEHGYVVDFLSGVWVFRPYEQEGLIGRTYIIRFNGKENVTAPNGTSLGGGGSGGVTGTNSLGSFDVDNKALVDDIKALLAITSNGVMIEGDSDAHVSDDSVSIPKISRNEDEARASGTVIYNPDSSTLMVVATRQQHEWIRGYLRAVDRPQKMLAFIIKFVETTSNPEERLGLRTDDTVVNTVTPYFFNVARSSGGVLSSGDSESDDSSGSSSQGSFSVAGTATTPFGFIMNQTQASVTLDLLKTDANTRKVSYVALSAVENRPLELRNVINIPYLNSSTSVDGGLSGGAITSSQTSALPVGTIMSLRGKIIEGKAVKTYVAIEETGLMLFRDLDGNPFPQTSESRYASEIIVRSGHSFSIVGLEKDRTSDTSRKIPVLGEIPVLGRLFRSEGKTEEKINLLIFITPHIINSYSGGVDEIPKGYGLGKSRNHGYIPGLALSIDDLREESRGIVSSVGKFRELYEFGNLNEEHQGAVNGLHADLLAMNEDFDEISNGRLSAEDLQLKRTLEDSLRRIRYLRRYLILSERNRL